MEGDSSNYSSRFLIDEFQQLKLELKEQRRREAGLDTKDLPPAEDAPPGSGYDTDSSAYGYGDWDWSFALHSRTIFGEIEAGADEDDIWDSALGVTGDFGPVTITLDQSWMERDFESGGSADFSTLTGAGRIDMSNFFNTGSLSHELKFGAAVTAAVQDGEIDFSGGGGQDFDMLRLGGDGWWELDLGNGVAPMIGLSAGYIDLDNGFGVGDLSGYYVRPVVGLNLTKGFDFCLDAGLVDIGGDGPDTDYREIGAALTLDWTALGFGLFDFVKSSKTSLDVHYGEFDLGAGAKNSQFMFGIGSTWKFGGSAAAGSDAGYERSYYDSIDGCNGGGALLPLTDIRLKMGF